MTERRFDIVTFDCYGTLIDWERGIGDAFLQASRAAGIAVDRQQVLSVYREVEPLVQRRAYQPYRLVLTETARQVAARLGWQVADDRASFLAESLPDWEPFPDTNPALERLAAAGYRLGILSNIDDDLLAKTRSHFTVDFDLVITAEAVRSYKPAHPHFNLARSSIGRQQWLHAAQSYFHDVAPARELGIPIAWINRSGESPHDGGQPDVEFGTLGELADWLVP